MPEEVQQGSWRDMARTGFQSVGLFLLVQFALKQFMGPQQKAEVTTVGSDNATKVQVPTTVPPFSERAPFDNDLREKYNHFPQYIAPIWERDTSLDISLFVSPSFNPPSPRQPGPAVLALEEKDFRYGTFAEGRDISTTFALPPSVQANGTLWAHLFVAISGHELDPSSKTYDPTNAFHFARPLNQYFKKPKVVKVRNLLDSSSTIEEDSEPESSVPEYASYYHPNFTLSFIPDTGTLNWPQSHPGVREWVQMETSNSRDASGQNTWYYPILYFNTFLQLRSHMTELNDTVTTLPLNIHLNSLSNWKFNILASMDYGFAQQREKAARGEKMPGGGDGSEIEEIKRILLDSNLYLLATTVIVGILHTIFEMLAFKNDVSHWRNKKDNVGVSVRTILANVFMQAVIFLYLLDNNENTSWMILMGQGMGILIEAWKITKTVDVRLRPTTAETTGWQRHLPYELKFEDKHKLTDTEKKTQEYDEIAFRYMYMIAVPLILAYAAYSLWYESHKSWYSFVITTLVGSVYAYGFLLMLPSLYINYRLQSVAHMPGKAMTYKVLSTFIDDLFAFTIKMPTLHRLATLRDDVVFFVYLYQSYVYKVDKGRVNEFGQGGEDGEEGDARAETVDVVKGEIEARKGEKDAVDGKVTGANGSTSATTATGRETKADVKRRRG